MSLVAPIGERGGPCRKYCTHEACERLRRIHDSLCVVCERVIGFNAQFEEISDGDMAVSYAHSACAELQSQVQSNSREADRRGGSGRMFGDEARPKGDATADVSHPGISPASQQSSKRLDTPNKEQHMSEQNGTKQQEKDRAHLAVISSMPVAGGLVPRTMDEAMSMAKLLAESQLLPTHLRGKPADVLVTMLKGIELGLKPMVAFSEIYVVEGRPGCSAATKRALVKANPLCEYAHFVESSTTKATYETKRRGCAPTRKTYTIEMAQAAGLAGKSNWKSHPASMLRARASSAEVDAEWPDVIQGMSSLDELQEIEGRVVDVKVNRPNLDSGSAPVAPTPSMRTPATTPPAPPKPPSAVPDEPLDDDFEKATAALTEPEPVKEEPKADGMTDFEKLHALLTEATEPKHLEALHGAVKSHPNADEMKTLKQLYIRRSTEMVNARKAAGGK